MKYGTATTTEIFVHICTCSPQNLMHFRIEYFNGHYNIKFKRD